MIHNKLIVIVAFLLLLLIYFPRSAHGITRSYLVTDPISLRPASPPGANVVVFQKNIHIENTNGGRFVISSNPDGTGDIQIGDELVVSNVNTFKSYSYTATRDCINFNSVLAPVDITHIAAMTGINNFNFIIRDRCGRTENIGRIYLVNLDIPGRDTFLNLPWDYEGKGLSFTEAALAMSSFFDHEYPLLSSGIGEPLDVIKYNGEKTKDPYSSHDGYDWAKVAKAVLGDPVLAAASGEATFRNSCTACGNMILIDHKNGYQTRYMHMQKEGLVVSAPGISVQVQEKQQIGKVGATGNVSPKGDAGAHIHFMVVEDKNKDGNFDDNIPDGVMDPFGWQSADPDPWEKYSFNYAGKERNGNKSYYLWNKAIDSINTTLTPKGGTFKSGKYTITFPENTINQDVKLIMEPQPHTQVDDTKESIGSMILTKVIHASGSVIQNFSKPFKLIIDITTGDLDKYKQDSVSIYSSQDGINWTKENTTIADNKASIEINHMTYFALIGEKRDTQPSVTEVQIEGNKKEDIYTSDVKVTLNPQDNEGGSGTDYTLYRLEKTDWEVYKEPLIFKENGHYAINYYSEDKDGNIEEVKIFEFDLEKKIDKEPPELEIYFDTNMKKLVITPMEEAIVVEENIKKKEVKRRFTDIAGNRLIMISEEDNNKKSIQFRLLSLQYNDNPAIVFEKEKQKYSFEIDAEDIKKLKQTFKYDDDHITLTYKEKNNKTVINLHDGKDKKPIELDGMKVLKIITEKGTLKYSY